MKRWIASNALVLIASGYPVLAEPAAIDTQSSVLTVRVNRAGVLSAFGHDHEITAPIAAGSVDVKGRRVDLRVDAKALRVRDEGPSEKDRSEIQKTMLGPEVLDTAQYPEIAFRSTSAEEAGPNAWKLHGTLTLHGSSRPVDVDVLEKDGHYTGHAVFKQTEFGIKPVKAGGGAVRVKDEVRIEFDVRLER